MGNTQNRADSPNLFDSYSYNDKQRSHYTNNAKQFSTLQEGDIIEVNNDGIQEYMIYAGVVGSKPNILYATCDARIQNQSQPPSKISQWLTGWTKTEDIAYSKNPQKFGNGGIQGITMNEVSINENIGKQPLKEKNFENVGPVDSKQKCSNDDLIQNQNPRIFNNNEIERICVRQATTDEIIGNRLFIKNNFENINLEPNLPEDIVNRAMFKVLDAKSSPHFQNSKDWVIWCRYGRDVITRETRVPSLLGYALGSGKY